MYMSQVAYLRVVDIDKNLFRPVWYGDEKDTVTT